MRPRTRDGVETARPIELSRYLRARSGILQPWLLRNQTVEREDYPVADTGWRGTTHVMMLYLRLVLRDLFPGGSSPTDRRYAS